MIELNLLEMIKNAALSMYNSKVFILFVLELIVLFIALIFSKLINKKMVKTVSIIASLILVGFYISNYISTLSTFIDNVSTRLMEVLYFPTTLEFIIMILASFIIMFATLFNNKAGKFIKVVNTVLPISVSFILLSIIEYINNNNIEFNEFSTFTDVKLMSLYELGMALFISWIVGLFIYKIDKFVLNRISNKQLVMPVLKADDEIELPKLKTI